MKWKDIPSINRRLIIGFLVVVILTIILSVALILRNEKTTTHSIVDDPNANQQMGVSISSEIQLEEDYE